MNKKQFQMHEVQHDEHCSLELLPGQAPTTVEIHSFFIVYSKLAAKILVQDSRNIATQAVGPDKASSGFTREV